MRQNFYRAGIEIRLKPGALTYWRQPGDAGVPPVFSFEGSENLAKADVLYPAPTRIREDEGEAFGYQDTVIFPLHVIPRDKTKPISLKLTANYAVCERICIPVKWQSEIIFPLADLEPQDAEVAAAEARVPQLLSKTETAEKVALAAVAHAQHPTWRLNWTAASRLTDLFVESPDGWYFETKKTEHENEFAIVAVEAPKTPPLEPILLRMTATNPQQNFEFTLALDAAGAAH